MEPLRDKIADIIDRETNARLLHDEIDILNGHEVAQSIIAALPDLVATPKGEIQEIIDGLSSSYKAKNGREVSIEGDDGEKCWILSNDGYEALCAAAAIAALTGVKP